MVIQSMIGSLVFLTDLHFLLHETGHRHEVNL